MQAIRPIQIVLLICMLAAAAGAYYLKPNIKMAEQRKVNLEQMIPQQFGDWKILPNQHVIELPPELAANLSRIYTETLSRTYANSKGQQVMLSIAYGADQSDDNSVHRPEVCYPAQGFEVKKIEQVKLEFSGHIVNAKRLLTVLGNRIEPVTYWTTIGDQISVDRADHKQKQLIYGLKQIIPDGMVFRVSSIDSDETKAYANQKHFLLDLERNLPDFMRLKIFGNKAITQ